MKREKLDFTDKELYYIALAIQSHLNSRETYWTSKSRNIFNKMFKKVVCAGLTRKNPESILHPIINFDDNES